MLRAHEKFQLKRELAEGKHTQRELADKYDVTQQAISAFAKTHRNAIEEIRADFENEFAGLWSAKKKNRLAALEEMAEAFEEDSTAKRAPKAARIRQQILRQIAEELGQLKIEINANEHVKYSVDGVDPADLT